MSTNKWKHSPKYNIILNPIDDERERLPRIENDAGAKKLNFSSGLRYERRFFTQCVLVVLAGRRCLGTRLSRKYRRNRSSRRRRGYVIVLTEIQRIHVPSAIDPRRTVVIITCSRFSRMSDTLFSDVRRHLTPCRANIIFYSRPSNCSRDPSPRSPSQKRP